jgi:pseudaminic acid cytidylyltransferase
MNIAIIPARGGSKRIKNKNVKIFNKKPIIELTYKILKKSKIFNLIILSSDSPKICKLGKKIGFDFILLRNKNLAKDTTDTKSVIKQVIIDLSKKIKVKNVCCVYPCNPFLQINDLKNCLKILKKNNNKFIFPVTNYSHPIDRAFRLNKSDEIKFFKKENANKNTQTFKESYHDAGQFYWGKKNTWLKNIFLHTNGIGYKIPNFRVVDIDNLNDWKKAEIIYKGLKISKKK